METKISENIAIVVLHLIKDDIIFLKEFKKFVPVLEKEIQDFSEGRDQAKDQILSYIKINEQATVNFVEYFLKNNPQVQINIDEIIQKYQTKDLRGKLFKISKTPEAFENFYMYIISNNSSFRQFSVTSEEDSWVIFFL